MWDKGPEGHTAAQTKDLDVVARLRPRECLYGGRKKHGLVIRMGNQQADALVAQDREARRDDGRRVDVQ